MSGLSKRSLIKLAGFSSIATAAALVGCGKKEEPAPAAAAPAATTAASAPAAKAAPLKIAFAYLGPVGDGGWTFAHDNARKAMVAALGDKVETTIVENVPESADAERVFRDMAGQGNQLIFGTSFGYMEPMLKVAADNPNAKFEHATGYKTSSNLSNYNARNYEGSYVIGVIAGMMTKTNTIGVVGSIPIPEVIRNIDAYTLGAQSVNPKIKTKVVWVNEWFNPPKETEAAQSLINGGADILMQNTDSPAVLQTAEKNGKFAFGWDSDMMAYGPKAHLASAIINWAPYYIESAQRALDGKWTGGGSTWYGMKENVIDVVSYGDMVPADVKAAAEKAKAAIKDGSLVVFKGPIMGSDGKEMLAAGAVADDKMLSGLSTYVKGVEGKIPTGK